MPTLIRYAVGGRETVRWAYDSDVTASEDGSLRFTEARTGKETLVGPNAAWSISRKDTFPPDVKADVNHPEGVES